MSTIALPEFIARPSLKKPLSQAVTFTPRQVAPSSLSAGAIRQPRYRIRFVSSRRQDPVVEAGARVVRKSSQKNFQTQSTCLEQAEMSLVTRNNPMGSRRRVHPQPLGSPVYPAAKTMQRGRLLLTRRGRLICRGLPLLTLATLVILGALAFIFPPQAQGSSSQPETKISRTVTVLHGDSLWDIAQQVAPEQDSRDVINRIMQINDLSSSQVQPGQVLEVPLYSE